MKTLSKCFLILIFFILTCVNSNAQFIRAAVTESGMSTGVDKIDNTGNDICEFGLNGDRFEVTVYDDRIGSGANSGLSWTVGGGTPSSGTVQFTFLGATQYWDPDVCLVTDGTYMYAVAVYLAYVPGSPDYCYYVMQCFYYDYGSNQFVSGGSTAFATYSSGSAPPSTDDFEVNIDGSSTDRSRFVIAFDDDQQNYVFAKFGLVDGCAHLCENTITVYDAASVGDNKNYTIPDVTFNDAYAYFVYLIFTNTGAGYWEKYEVASVWADGGEFGCPEASPFVEYTSSTNAFDNYDDPRIASPNVETSAYGATYDDYSVVVTETDYGYNNIISGYNYTNGAGGNYIQAYNDGSFLNSPYDITRVYNSKPVITYTPDGRIVVSWLFENSLPDFTTSDELYANYPIAVNCDQYGDIVFGEIYMNVPESSVTTEHCSSISIAGKNGACASTVGSMDLYSFSVDTKDLYTKIVAEGLSVLRLANNSSVDKVTVNELLFSPQILSSIEPTQEFMIHVYDILAREVFVFEGNISEIRDNFSNQSHYLNTGVYIAQIQTNDASINAKGKLFISHED